MLHIHMPTCSFLWYSSNSSVGLEWIMGFKIFLCFKEETGEVETDIGGKRLWVKSLNSKSSNACTDERSTCCDVRIQHIKRKRIDSRTFSSPKEYGLLWLPSEISCMGKRYRGLFNLLVNTLLQIKTILLLETSYPSKLVYDFRELCKSFLNCPNSIGNLI